MHPITNIVREIHYFNDRIATVLATFDRMQWFRSVDGEKGPYVPVTAGTSQPAELRAPRVGPYALSARELRVRTTAGEEVVTLTGPDPVSAQDAADQINLGITGAIASVEDGRLVLRSVDTGTSAILQLLPTEGRAMLGFRESTSHAHGLDEHLDITSGVLEVTYVDHQSHENYWYKARYVQSYGLAVSEFTPPIPAKSCDALERDKTIVAYVRLVDLRGYPVVGRKITLVNRVMPNVVDSRGVMRFGIDLVTDANGYAQTRVLRGVAVDVCIDGSGHTRRIMTPTTGDGFDLLDPSLVASDEFGIKTLSLEYAIRTTL